jgi:hypothetical protein
VKERRLGNLATPASVQKLQTALHAKAKTEAGYRFYALYDKIYREDILAHAYAQCRSNKGAPGVDGQDFSEVEAYGVQRWLGELAKALKEETYRPEPIRRVFIPKANGKLRPLKVPESEFDFLGYTFGRMYKRTTGQVYVGVRPSKKSIRRMVGKIHAMTTVSTTGQATTNMVEQLNRTLCGWANYFRQLEPTITAPHLDSTVLRAALTGLYLCILPCAVNDSSSERIFGGRMSQSGHGTCRNFPFF